MKELLRMWKELLVVWETAPTVIGFVLMKLHFSVEMKLQYRLALFYVVSTAL